MTDTPTRTPDRGLMHVLFGPGGLRLALVLGGLADIATGIWMMVRPATFLALTHMPANAYQAAAFWPRYVGVFLFVLPWFYILASLDLVRYRRNIDGAVYGRSLGCAFYVLYYTIGGADIAFLLAGVSNLAFAVYYGVALGRLASTATTTS